MSVRMAVAAGQFYEGSSSACRNQIKQMLAARSLPDSLPEKIIAGVVPHAGWVFSGDLAAMVFAALKQQQTVDTFVLFGAVHTLAARKGLLYDAGQWGSPLGTIHVDEDLARAILQQDCPHIQPDRTAHSREHSLEVQVPIIQYLFPDSKIVPLMVPPIPQAPEIGRAVARAVTAAAAAEDIVALASTDLTHYGPSYAYTPMGTGPEALAWAKQQNDRHFINLALALKADALVDSAQMYHNACGAGAVAATVAAAQELGARKGCLLAHTTSAEVMAQQFSQPSDDAVGYAAIIFA